MFKNKNLILLILTFTFISLEASFAQSPFDELLAPVSAGKAYSKKAQKSSPMFNGTDFADNNGARKTSDAGKSISDSSKKENRIEKIYSDGESIKLKLKIADQSDNISIGVYTMLGRKAIDVYNGYPRKDGTYEINAQYLQNAMYICIVQGPDFKLAEKFVVSK